MAKNKKPETTGKKNQNGIEVLIDSDDPKLIAAIIETVDEIFKVAGNKKTVGRLFSKGEII